jgi:hypothetical protein
MLYWACADGTWIEARREYDALVLAEVRGTTLTGAVLFEEPNVRNRVFRWGKVSAGIIAEHMREMYAS